MLVVNIVWVEELRGVVLEVTTTGRDWGFEEEVAEEVAVVMGSGENVEEAMEVELSGSKVELVVALAVELVKTLEVDVVEILEMEVDCFEVAAAVAAATSTCVPIPARIFANVLPGYDKWLRVWSSPPSAAETVDMREAEPALSPESS